MIFITGDVHSPRMGGWEQQITGSELKSAQKYLEILKKNKLSCTLFVNGICLEENEDEVRKILEYDVEVGGHTYNNFGKLGMIRSYFNRKIFGCVYGSRGYQKRDIKKTKRAFERFGLKMNSWRTHAFGSNKATFDLLSSAGVKYVSDLLGNVSPFKENVIHMPINIPVDSNTIAYGPACPENRSPFASCTKGRITKEEWFEIIKKRIEDNEKKKKVSILLLHPATMAAIDNFKLLEKIAKFLYKFESKKISEFKI